MLPRVLKNIILEYLYFCPGCNKIQLNRTNNNNCQFVDSSECLNFNEGEICSTDDNGYFIEFYVNNEDKIEFDRLIEIDKLRRKHNLYSLLQNDYKFKNGILIKLQDKYQVRLPKNFDWRWDGFSYGCVDIHFNDNGEWIRIITGSKFIDFSLYDFCEETPKFNLILK